jgi:hypothetical protein
VRGVQLGSWLTRGVAGEGPQWPAMVRRGRGGRRSVEQGTALWGWGWGGSTHGPQERLAAVPAALVQPK